MITGLPSSNNFWLLSLAGGLLLMLFGVNKIDTSYSILDEELKELKKELESSEISLEKTKSVSKWQDSILSILNSKNISSRESDSLNQIIKQNMLYFENAKKESKERDFKSSQRKLKLEIKKAGRNADNALGILSIAMGIILFSNGYFKLSKFQVYRDRVSFNDYLNLNVRFENCQSCGMNLVDDQNFDKMSNYCSFCFQDNEFVLKDISLDEFKLLVGEQLEKKKILPHNRKSYMRKLSNLERWKTKFDWENNN